MKSLNDSNRDLKTENILVDSQDNIKLIDFGVSKILNNYMTFTKSQVGTPCNMSPEIIRNLFHDHKVDIWSLGILLYEITHKRLPFQCKNNEQLYLMINDCKYKIDPSVHAGFRVIIDRCIQVSPHKRIKLNILLNHCEIKKFVNAKQQAKNNKIITQIEKIPNMLSEWENILQQFPSNIKKTPEVKLQKTIDFMQHYTKDDLIFLNSKLIDNIVNKDITISNLKKEISFLKQQLIL